MTSNDVSINCSFQQSDWNRQRHDITDAVSHLAEKLHINDLLLQF